MNILALRLAKEIQNAPPPERRGQRHVVQVPGGYCKESLLQNVCLVSEEFGRGDIRVYAWTVEL